MRPSDVRQRLARAILRGTEKNPSAPFLISQVELALGLDIRQQTLGYHFNWLNRAGIIMHRPILGRTEVTVLDRDALLRLADGGVKEDPGGGGGVDPSPVSTQSSDQGAVARHTVPEREEVPR